MDRIETRLIAAWALGLGIMLALYFAGNPFSIYDDIVIVGGLLFYSFT